MLFITWSSSPHLEPGQACHCFHQQNDGHGTILLPALTWALLPLYVVPVFQGTGLSHLSYQTVSMELLT